MRGAWGWSAARGRTGLAGESARSLKNSEPAHPRAGQVIAVRRDNPVLAEQAATLVKAMIASGAIADSIKRWSLTGAAPAQNGAG